MLSALDMPGVPADDMTLRLVADAIRCGSITSLAVLKSGDRYNVWANANPAPFELLDEDGNLLWMEGVGNVSVL